MARSSSDHAGGAWEPALAALDLGTNNCRLLVARPQAHGFEVIDSFSRIVRLGEGVAASGRLKERAMARTIAAIQELPVGHSADFSDSTTAIC